ncbi:hypothetical protein OG548_42855 [Streptomyces sp. NBC_01356]|uniref:hypothetical protein n=1 Tax=Streptomyces sp. NBC_01356 TaxID=2903836 RepID=UPI002E324EEC|nr:hypothetical protein [Streptomyces sp. NBC_01356]
MALPLYPELKTDLEDWFIEVFKEAARQELGPFSESPHFIQHEGTSHSYETIDGEEREFNYQDMTAEILMSSAEVVTKSLHDVLQLLVDKGEEFGRQQARYHHSRLNEIIEQAGNVVDGGGQKLSLDLWLKALEQLHISFDDHENPKMPTMVIHPDMAPRVKELMREAEGDETAKARYREIMERKLEEWHEEQNRRKLVD